MIFINSLVMLSGVCLLTSMSLKSSDGAAVDVYKLPRFKYKEIMPTRPTKTIQLSSTTKAQLFVPQKKVKTRVDQQTTKLVLSLWAKAVRDNAKEKERGWTKRKRINAPEPAPEPEITLYIPKFTQNTFGDWVHHNWGPTPGGVWQDTRFNQGSRRIERMTKEQEIDTNYYPGEAPLSTVCAGKSTIYNYPRNILYLSKGIHAELIKERVFWNVLRREIYKLGRSEECHDPVKYTRWRDYHECSLRRNQRIEYLIPKYPLLQRGYRAFYKVYLI